MVVGTTALHVLKARLVRCLAGNGARTYATRARQHLGRSSDRNTTKLLSETRYEPLNRFGLATEKHLPRRFTRPTLGGGNLNSYRNR